MRNIMIAPTHAKFGFMSAVLIAALLTACSETAKPHEDAQPAFRLGALRTQVPGGDPKLAAPGQLVGTIVGKGVEAPIDDSDKPLIADATRKAYALPIGEKSVWNNAANSHSGTVISTREGWRTNGTYCREFQETILIGKDTYQGYGASCKEADGTWKRVEVGEFPTK